MKKLLLSITLISIPILPVATMLSCSSIVTEDLKISITKNQVIQSDIDKLAESFSKLSTLVEKVDALNQLFSGVTAENFDNFTISIIQKANTIPSSFTLTGKPGFLFGTNTVLKSRTVSLNLMIKPIPSSIEVINQAIQEYNNASANPIAQVLSLSKVFTGITDKNIGNFVVEISDNISLISKEGYMFDGINKISSIVSS